MLSHEGPIPTTGKAYASASILIFLHSVTVLVIGVAKGGIPEMERLVRRPSRMLMVQSVAELLPGRAGFDVISKLFRDVNYSEFVIYCTFPEKKKTYP